MDSSDVLSRLEMMANQANVDGMARYGIKPNKVYGISMPTLKKLAREIGRDHKLALELWDSGYHEARMVAALIAEPRRVTEKQMEAWAGDFDSWALCDSVCGYLLDRTPCAWKKASEWSERQEELVKRAAFALMAWLAVHDKNTEDEKYIALLTIIKREAADTRNLVSKSVNWALRQIGKRNRKLNSLAIQAAHEIEGYDSRQARWVAHDALSELTSEKVQSRFRNKE